MKIYDFQLDSETWQERIKQENIFSLSLTSDEYMKKAKNAFHHFESFILCKCFSIRICLHSLFISLLFFFIKIMGRKIPINQTPECIDILCSGISLIKLQRKFDTYFSVKTSTPSQSFGTPWMAYLSHLFWKIWAALSSGSISRTFWKYKFASSNLVSK